MSTQKKEKKLGWFLCWAVVFADIGTSLYYVPGILFGEVTNLAGLFVLMSSLVFVLLVLKYIEITDRYPEGGGVVTVASHAFGPWFGALGGMFITVDYFLTAAISSVSGFAYLNSIIPLHGAIVAAAIISVGLLGVLNLIGIKESAKVTAIVAVLAFIVDVVLVVFVLTQVTPAGWMLVFQSLTRVSTLTPWALLTGFAGSFLAFSGLESISQLSPAMQEPRKKIAGIAMALVVGAIMMTSPLLTLFSTNLLTAKLPGKSETILESVHKVKEREHILLRERNPELRAELQLQIREGKEYSERFISELGGQYGGFLLKLAIVATASILLIFASNTAIIGAYHVFMALSRQNFLPHFLQHHNSKFGTPQWAILLAVAPPIAIILLTNGDVAFLGQLYAFGLLGAFGLSSLGLDVVRWKEKKSVTFTFALGLLTTALVFVAWGTNLYAKQLATMFGGSITLIGLTIGFIVRKYFPHHHIELASVTKRARDIVQQGMVFIPVYDEFDPKVFAFAGEYAKRHKKELILMYIREFTDIYQTVSEDIHKDEEAVVFIRKALGILAPHEVPVHVLYKSTSDIADAINWARGKVKPSLTIVTPHKASGLFTFLRGNVLKQILAFKNGDVMIYSGQEV